MNTETNKVDWKEEFTKLFDSYNEDERYADLFFSFISEQIKLAEARGRFNGYQDSINTITKFLLEHIVAEDKEKDIVYASYKKESLLNLKKK